MDPDRDPIFRFEECASLSIERAQRTAVAQQVNWRYIFVPYSELRSDLCLLPHFGDIPLCVELALPHFGRIPIFGYDCDQIFKFDHINDSGERFCGRNIHTLERPFDKWTLEQIGVEHAGYLLIEPEDCVSHHLWL